MGAAASQLASSLLALSCPPQSRDETVYHMKGEVQIAGERLLFLLKYASLAGTADPCASY